MHYRRHPSGYGWHSPDGKQVMALSEMAEGDTYDIAPGPGVVQPGIPRTITAIRTTPEGFVVVRSFRQLPGPSATA
jgi:hypothetical protein